MAPRTARTRGRGTITTVVLAASLTVAAPVALAVPGGAPNPPGREDCIERGETFTPVPWPQTLWRLPVAWTLTRGLGVTVAVLSSGVDGSSEQLAGRVDPGAGLLPGRAPAPGDLDCAGLGTGLAGVIAARPLDGVGFRGVAPQARILPVAVAESAWIAAPGVEDAGSADSLAQGLRLADDAGARVILVGGYLATDAAPVRDAVARAVGRGALVVAPVRDASGGFAGPSFPAAYPGVLGVSAVAQDLTMVVGTEAGTGVDLVAPGQNVATTARGSGHAVAEGTPVAAAAAAGVAALVRAQRPELTPEQVVEQLRGTSGPVADEDTARVGAGLLDPARAVQETVGAAAAPARAAVSPLTGRSAEVRAAEAAADRRRVTALAVSGGALALALSAYAGVALAARSRRA